MKNSFDIIANILVFHTIFSHHNQHTNGGDII